MKSLKELLKSYEIDIKSWRDDFGEGHLFLAHREALIPFEGDKLLFELDKKALEVIYKDKSIGSDRLFLDKLKEIVEANIEFEKVA